jgi:glyoxylase-like metal-dependent hydrolase (beta-lactamase superfamily II)
LKSRLREIDSGIFCIKIPQPFYPDTNVFLITGEALTLIDAGFPGQETVTILSDSLKHLGYSLQELSTIIYTHPHVDHLGGGIFINQEVKVKNIGYRGQPSGEEENFESFTANARKDHLEIGRYVLEGDLPGIGKEELFNYIETYFPQVGGLAGIIDVKDGETLDLGGAKLNVIHTPGHSSYHICLYEPARGILFSGDLLIGRLPPLFNVRDYLKSLTRIGQEDIRLILPGHGPVRKWPEKVILKAEQAVRGYEMKVLSALDGKSHTVMDLVGTIYGRSPENIIEYFNQVGMVGSFLRMLIEEGRVSLRETDGKIFYELN